MICLSSFVFAQWSHLTQLFVFWGSFLVLLLLSINIVIVQNSLSYVISSFCMHYHYITTKHYRSRSWSSIYHKIFFSGNVSNCSIVSKLFSYHLSDLGSISHWDHIIISPNRLLRLGQLSFHLSEVGKWVRGNTVANKLGYKQGFVHWPQMVVWFLSTLSGKQIEFMWT